jgi:XTP/dITP diphosphohydrolase
MSDFTFVTSNELKILAATAVCEPAGIHFEHHSLDFSELQSYDGELIARDKAQQAFEALKSPVVITDDSWIIPGLGGFPGPYMRQVNHWLTTDNFLDLTRSLIDRRIILRQIIVYQDADNQHLFSTDIPGILLTEARGNCPVMHFKVISFDDGHRSAAQVVDAGKSSIDHLHSSWNDLCEWLQSR